MTSQTTFDAPPIIGERVSYRNVGPTWASTGSGIYLGVALDEEDGVPYHYFIDGEINGHAQRSHGFPADPSTSTTTDLTPTALILGALGEVEPCADCGHPIAWFEVIGDWRHLDPERTCWLHQRALAEEAS